MLTLLLGRSGSGKSRAVFAQLETLVAQGYNKVVLVVPEQYSFMSERDLLDKQLANKVTVVSFTRLAEMVLREVGDVDKPMLDDGSRALLMSRALAEAAQVATGNGQTLFGAQPEQLTDTAYVEQMLDFWEEMRMCGVSVDMLEGVQQGLRMQSTVTGQQLAKKVEDYHAVFSVYEGLVATCGYEDTDNLTRAGRRLPESHLPDGAAVLVDGFKGFTAQELVILEQLMCRAEDVTVTLCTDASAGSARESTLFSPVTKTVRRLRAIAENHNRTWIEKPLTENIRHQQVPALCALEAGLYHPVPCVWETPTDAVTVTPCFDVYEECTYVARRIRRLVREEGLRYRDICVVARDLSTYSGLLEDALELAGVSYSMDARQSMIDEPLLVHIRAALRVAVGGWQTEAILRLLKTDLTPLSPVDTARLENYVYLWNIDGAAWTQDWTENPDGLGKKETPASARTLEQLNCLREQVVRPLAALREALRKGVDGRAFAMAVYHFLSSDKGLSERVVSLVHTLESMQETRLAEHAARVWDETMILLDRCAGVLRDYTMPAARWEELFAMLAQMVDLGQLPQGLDAVTVGAADRIRYHRPKVVFVLGANDGVFPAYPQENLLFGDNEREQINPYLADYAVSLDADVLMHCIEERYYAYLALTAADERVLVSYHTAESSEKPPLVAMMDAILPQHAVESAANDGRCAESSQEMFSYVAAEYARPTEVTASLRRVLAEDPLYAARLKAVERAATNKPFCIQEQAVAADLFGTDMRLSASQAEAFHECRFAYFCKYGLSLKERKRAVVDSASFGNIVHYVMETVLPMLTATDGLIDRLRREDAACETMDTAALDKREQQTQTALAEELTEAVHRAVAAYLDTFMGSKDGKSAQFLYHIELAKRAAYNMLWHTVMEFRQSDFRPIAFELNIQSADADEQDEKKTKTLPAIHLAFERGSVRLVGKVDRVDLYINADKTAYVRVVDYKTGNKEFKLREITHGLGMQMLLYLFNICDYPQWVSQEAKGIAVNEDTTTVKTTPAGVLYHLVSDLAVPRGSGDAVMKKRLQSMRMNGLVLDDVEVVLAMEKTVATKRNESSSFIPVKLSGNQPKGDVASEQQFALLRRVVEDLMLNMANDLLDGDIAAFPVKKGRDAVCAYCEYASICARDEDDAVWEIDKGDTATVLRELEQAAQEVSGDE